MAGMIYLGGPYFIDLAVFGEGFVLGLFWEVFV
jgi:hypothetical protein